MILPRIDMNYLPPGTTVHKPHQKDAEAARLVVVAGKTADGLVSAVHIIS
jgi:hypothetical protein